MSSAILVVGGGFSGLTAALEAAELGYEVYIIEKEPFLGGRVSQLNKYFPKLCPPSCGLEIQFQRIKKNPKVKFFTQAELIELKGEKGNYLAKIKIAPRYTSAHSANLKELSESLNGEKISEFEFKLTNRKALYLNTPFAFPNRYVLDKSAITKSDQIKLASCSDINLNDTEKEIELNIGSIVFATGWKPYDATRLSNLGAGQLTNCISNMQLERLASPCGPTLGKIQRPSDSEAPRNVAFVQCAGSRDQNHLNYCSYICCMASLKQALYIREQYPKAEITIYYIDLRAPGRYDNMLKRIKADPKITLIKGKVAGIKEDCANKDIIIEVEDAIKAEKWEKRHDLVVLATGMQPSLAGQKLPFNIDLDEDGFILDAESKGIFAAGCASKPLDVMRSAQSGTSAAMKAIQVVRGR
ncbi:CoB--CoM heterodisulfide reductase iron-sulfur subunit A family protein [Desulfovibrio litoralis]|uniref:Putative adenylylsulfate reductase-associated electron transfer protein QmoA n=1 Tax=Desulfovibrio litoralis DSM 11393 TaxID=1121455 RepID=A0A1M7RZS9_9BACT|nr:FAD-dependent oxidoreductase [Desulfovibrio litoralis]SHN51602.1 putative adenylylsulfate reductase-associated electron transfer protein QmoA [Desulfovibrio litoralis DSM 11393]